MPEKERALALLAERRGQARRAAHGHGPVGRSLGDLLEVPVAREHRRRGRLPPPRQARIAVGAVADEREPVRNRPGIDAELGAHRRLVATLAGAAIELDDPIAAHALRQVLVRRAHDHLLDPRVGRGHLGRRAQRVVGLELDHGPDDHPEGAERVLQRLELGVEHRVDALARLVVRPERVPERFDDVVGGHAEVGRAAFEHSQDGPDDAADRSELLRPLSVERGGRGQEVAEQLVGAIDQVDAHGCEDTAP